MRSPYRFGAASPHTPALPSVEAFPMDVPGSTSHALTPGRSRGAASFLASESKAAAQSSGLRTPAGLALQAAVESLLALTRASRRRGGAASRMGMVREHLQGTPAQAPPLTPERGTSAPTGSGAAPISPYIPGSPHSRRGGGGTPLPPTGNVSALELQLASALAAMDAEQRASAAKLAQASAELQSAQQARVEAEGARGDERVRFQAWAEAERARNQGVLQGVRGAMEEALRVLQGSAFVSVREGLQRALEAASVASGPDFRRAEEAHGGRDERQVDPALRATRSKLAQSQQLVSKLRESVAGLQAQLAAVAAWGGGAAQPHPVAQSATRILFPVAHDDGNASSRGETSVVVDASAKTTESLQAQLSALQAKYDTLKQRLVELTAAAADSTASSKAATAQLAALRTQQQAAVQPPAAPVAGSDSQAAEWRRRAEAAEAALAAHSAAPSGSDAASSELQKLLLESQETISSLRAQVETTQKAGDAAADAARAETAAAQKQVEALKELLGESQKAIKAASKAKAKAAKAHAKELAALRQEQQDGQVAGGAAAAEQAAEQAAALAAAEEARADVEAQRDAAQATVEELKQRLTALEGELGASSSAAQRAQAAAEQQASEAAATVKKLQRELQRAQDEAAEAKAAAAAAQAAGDGIQQSAQRVRGRSVALRDAVSAAKEHIGTDLASASRDIFGASAAAGGGSAGLFGGLQAAIAGVATHAAGMAERYRKEMRQRKELFNQLQELRGNIRVFCRVRPLLPFEVKRGDSAGITFPDEGELQVDNKKRGPKSWEFDKVFQPGTQNSEVFEDIAPLVLSVMDGYNACIFAYGQTGSGKTHTMEGEEGNRGMNYRALERLFKVRDERAAEGDFSFSLSVTLLEIYNETIRDMLCDPKAPPKKLVVRESAEGMTVPGLTQVDVGSLQEVLDLIKHGYGNRTAFATDMNEHSSRSHCILSVHVAFTNNVEGSTARGKLHLIDLAGSERVGRSGATGERLKEAQAINKSLSALGDVIAARASKRGHTPFRNSVLTFLLQDSLSGNSKTLMFVNVSPALSNGEESHCSLNFAARVRAVELGKATRSVERKAPGSSSGSGKRSGGAAPAPAQTSASRRRR